MNTVVVLYCPMASSIIVDSSYSFTHDLRGCITLKPEQNGHYFAEDNLKYSFLNEKFCIFIKIPLKYTTFFMAVQTTMNQHRLMLSRRQANDDQIFQRHIAWLGRNYLTDTGQSHDSRLSHCQSLSPGRCIKIFSDLVLMMISNSIFWAFSVELQYHVCQ